MWTRILECHNSILRDIASRWNLCEKSMNGPEVLFTLYNSALAEKERSSVPLLGHSTDRRVLEHVREVFHDDNVHVLVCFMCACKEVSHKGYNKCGKLVEKGNICYRWAHKPTILQTMGGRSR